MWKRQKVNASSSSSEVDFVQLCEDVVQRIEEVLKREKVLYKQSCKLLAMKLSLRIACIRELVESCARCKAAFVPLLATLHRHYEKAEALVKQCGEEDWCAAAVFRCGNHLSFSFIVRHVDSVGTAILKCAKKYTAISSTMEDTFKEGFFSSLFYHDDREYVEELRTRLEGVRSERTSSTFRIFGSFSSQQADLEQQHLAGYLLKIIDFQKVPKRHNNIRALEDIFWEKSNEPIGTWGDVTFLGSGSGASGVCKTSWLGVPCAKKEFHGVALETTFKKEALLMARIERHPNIVGFICCGNGKQKGNRFIAMELMEKSLLDLIEERNGEHFSLDVALDIIQQIADGLIHLSPHSVAHRDLKPHNIVVKTLRSAYHEDYYDVKLVDFGTSKIEVEDSKSYTMSVRGVGTTRYRAPEVHPSTHLEGLGKVNWWRADMYSFAMTCAHVLTLSQPFENLESLGDLHSKILEGLRPVLPIGCPKKLVELLKKCWSTDPSKRPSRNRFHSKLEEIILNNMVVLIPAITTAITIALAALREDNPVENAVPSIEDNLVENVVVPSRDGNLVENIVILSKEDNVERNDIKEEKGQIKEEGHTSFFTAQDVSLCSEVVSQERDSKVDVSKQSSIKLES